MLKMPPKNSQMVWGSALRNVRIDFVRALSRSIATAFLFFTITSSVAGQSVLTQHNDVSRTGQNNAETILNTTNVNVTQFGKLFAQPTDGQIYAQPLYVPGVTINGATHNVLVVATENDSVYAFDADSNTGVNAAPLWRASLVDAAHGASTGETPVNSSTTDCTDLQPQIGITSTPVIDPVSNTIYVEAKSTNGTNYFHRLHALDLLTGNEKVPGPIQIAATVSGTGDGSTNGQLIFDSATMSSHQLARPGLLLMNGTIYISFASHCDFSPFHGWLFAYDAATFTQTSVYVTTPNGGLGGFWMSGAGMSADSGGNIYIASGNGDFDTINVPATETSDTLLKLGTTNQILTLLDYFTPQDQGTLETDDRDLGSGGVLLLPDQPGSFPHIMVQAGKEGRIYVVNRDQLTTDNSHYCSGCSNDTEIIEESSSGAIGGMFSGPAYWNNNIYFWGVGDVLKSIPIANGLPDFTNISSNPTSQLGFPGASLSVSSNGTATGTAILWAIDATQYGSPGPGPGPAVLHAFDATNISDQLWSSAQSANNRDAAGNAVKFSTPTISNGKVYVGTSSEVDVYGLLIVASPTGLLFSDQAVGTSSASQTVTVTNNLSTALSITSIAFSGTNASNYSETDNCLGSVAAEASCSINVTFSPTATGTLTGALNITDNAANPQTVALTGTGIPSAPIVSLSSTNVAFATQSLGTTSAAQTVTLQNAGTAILNIQTVALGGANAGDFAIASGSTCTNGATVAPNSSCVIQLTFTPTGLGTRSAAVGITDNAVDSPETIVLGGTTTPTPLVTVTPSSVSFPSQYVGSSGLPQSVNLTNNGNAPLSITSVTASPADFAMLSACGSTLAAGASCAVSVSFDPTAAGTRLGTLRMNDNAPGSPQTVALSGTGQDFSLAATSSASMSISAGQTANFSVAVSPAGGFNQSVALACTGAPSLSTCAVTPSSVALNGSAAATVAVSVTTTAASLSPTTPSARDRYRTLYLITELLALSLLIALLHWRRGRHPRLAYGLVMLLLLCAGVTMSACNSGGGASGGSGGNQGTPQGTYTLVVAGTFTSASTSLTHKVNLSLVVQ